MTGERLDVALVRRNLARSREQARALVDAGRVVVDGRVTGKPATRVTDASRIELVGGERAYVSRAAHKLIGALDDLDVPVTGRRCLDAGASTGGFTQVLLERGAASVIAVDVGHGQLAPELRGDSRVQAYDRVNIRDAVPERFGGRVELLVADLSFISLRLVLPALVRLVEPAGELLVMVKPQFEVGRDRLGSGGVVRDPADRAAAIAGVVEVAERLGLAVLGRADSRLPGPAGNLEHFVRLARPSVWPVRPAERPTG